MENTQPKYKRILLKLSGEALAAGADGILNFDFIVSVAEAIKKYSEKEPRGEYVLVVEGYQGTVADGDADGLSELTPEEHVARYEAEGMARMDAIKRAAKDRGMTKSELYKIINN